MNDDMPASPMTELAAAALSLHEMYMMWQHVGFSEEQAFQLVRDQFAHVLALGNRD